MNQSLTLALSKGRIFDETLPLLEAAGIKVTDDPEKSRKLILPTSDPAIRVVIVRASDVPPPTSAWRVKMFCWSMVVRACTSLST